MRLVVGSDHAAYALKEYLKAGLAEEGHSVNDVGTFRGEPVDYPEIGRTVAEAVAQRTAERGIALCGTGIGMCMVANKVRGVRAALCHNEYTARMSRAHNDANVLTIGARVTAKELAWEIVRTWLTTEFEGGRHARRVAGIMSVETQD